MKVVRPPAALAILAALPALAFLALAAVPLRAAEEGLASWYGGKFQGRRTANGEIFDTEQLTAAHRTLPFGTRVKVTSLEDGRSVVVRINDRGPFVEGRVIDLSRAAAARIGIAGRGVGPVRLEVLAAGEAEAPPALEAAAAAPAAAARGAAPLYAVQLGAFRDRGNARRLAERAAARGFGPVLHEGADGVVRVVLAGIAAGELDGLTQRLVREGFERFLVRGAIGEDVGELPAQPAPSSGAAAPMNASPIQVR